MSRPVSIIRVYVLAALLAGGLVTLFTTTVLNKRQTMASEIDSALTRVDDRRIYGATLSAEAARAAIDALLDDFHAAAAEADLERYLGHLAKGALFVGTDASERWTVDEFRDYAKPHFDEGHGWTYTAEERSVDFAPGGRSAAFFEHLRNEKYGVLRGSGTVIHDGERWRILHYVMSFAVPNELAPDLVERTAQLGR